MSFPYYAGAGQRSWPEGVVSLPGSHRRRLTRPEDYIADPGLVDAVNVALLLGQPLLLTGEPGTGKTQLAYSLAWELGLGEPLKFETKSTSVARDLFYTYDSLGRFQAAQSGTETAGPLAYMSYSALGLAILLANEPSAVADYLPPGFQHGGQQRSIVLIDEVDKAPRDFPNDILNELEQLYFRIPELGNVRIEMNPEAQPVVIITSNSEKNLPDAFLRRCVYYNIPFPEKPELEHIVACRLGEHAGGSSPFLSQALDLFLELRKASNGLRKRPATAELLGWLLAMREASGGAANPLENREIALKTVSSLVKTEEDHEKAVQVIRQWTKPPSS
jgi:MoxR-like ATPase